MPGDIVELEGDTDYEGGVLFDDQGSEAMPIIVRGVGGGARPRISGGDNTIEAAGNHYVFENLDISGGSSRCFFHHAHDITLRDSVVHDCPRHGILGADNDSGSLLLERVEVHHCGDGDRYHQIYMATDEVAYPGAVFRMQFCWVHDANGGNNVKSRAERNEIYSNWIEGAFYHELELIGPDPAGGVAEDQAREDSDVVGNVLVKRGDNERFAVVRFGGDGTGRSLGRYRFAFNTVVVAPGSTAAVFRLFSGLESVEMHGNVFAMRGGGPVNLLREAEAEWTSGRAIAGSDNWVPTGSTNVPSEWTGTVVGDDPGLVELDDLGALDLRPASEASPVVDTATAPPPPFVAHPFARPLERPTYSPVRGAGSVPRPVVGPIDRGAYEYGSAPLPMPDGGAPSADAGGPERTDAGAGPNAASGSCGCRTWSSARPSAGLTLLAMMLLVALRRRRSRARPQRPWSGRSGRRAIPFRGRGR
jgi:MYXO-CTERM domain-containing protein